MREDPNTPNKFDAFEKEKLTIDLVKANVYGILLAIPTIIIFAVPYYFIWGSFKGSSIWYIAILIGLLPGIVLHELIHGITWAHYAEDGFKSIKFGIKWKLLTPYCHCQEPLTVRRYMLGAAMPGIVLGIAPALLAVLIGSAPLLWFGIFFTIPAVGDFMMINLLKNENGDDLVQDHPDEVGCFIYRKPT